MKITFVQNDAEYEETQRVVRAGLSLRKAKKGTWVIPPALSKQGDQFVVVDSQGKDVYVESFNTVDGALAYALGVCDVDTKFDKLDFDQAGSLKKHGNFV